MFHLISYQIKYLSIKQKSPNSPCYILKYFAPPNFFEVKFIFFVLSQKWCKTSRSGKENVSQFWLKMGTILVLTSTLSLDLEYYWVKRKFIFRKMVPLLYNFEFLYIFLLILKQWKILYISFKKKNLTMFNNLKKTD